MIRHSIEKQFDLPAGAVLLDATSLLDKKIRTACEGTLKCVDMHALADFFRNTADMFATGEFWGKLMRASCLICGYTKDEKLRKIIDDSAADMLSIQRADGCISTCPDSVQPKGTNGSDLWERKYVLIGLLSYYELTGSAKALNACVELIHYTNNQVGNFPKTPITQTGWAFGGIESSSILEPVMRVYNLTKDASALELGKHIVESGCCSRENIFEATRLGKSPKDIGWNGKAEESIAKAYEMMSCFEGLCEYYCATEDDEALKTAEVFWDKVFNEEITLLGSGGADAPFNLGPGTGEQWNRTAYEQTNPDINLMMETCVTVYWMRLCRKLLCLTGKVKYADELEKSLYNAIFGALRPDGKFFEYFPRFNGQRNPKVNYSFNINGFELSCCTANGPTGLGMAPYFAFSGTPNGVAVNLYENGSVCVPIKDGSITLKLESLYPREGVASLKIIAVDGKPKQNFEILLRVPYFVESFTVQNGQEKFFGTQGKYLSIKTEATVGKIWEIFMQIPLVRHLAPHGSNRAGDNFEAFTYGSLLLARDGRDCEKPLQPLPNKEPSAIRIEPPHRNGFITAHITIGGNEYSFIDYMSAGNNWDGGSFASWIPFSSII